MRAGWLSPRRPLRNYLPHRCAAHEEHVEPVWDECGLVIDGSVAAETPAQQIWSAIAGNQLLHKFVQRLFNGSGSGVDGSGVVLPAR
ncbi:hypothetical protein GCM10012285_07080 [Streptomyces kronopolitis]|uniref:Uncharacterized protein n=1 Tax=Streptomyces kronopolitis TaxID=1612435 RepID=A0ABQ2J278_9ACTN|nr:hypothetical protein GCM10012285_07080 [Streptomyces kronopolitis]